MDKIDNIYTVKLNYCKCHPETCSCNDWAIYDIKNEKVSSHFHKEEAEYYCKLYNKKEKNHDSSY